MSAPKIGDRVELDYDAISQPYSKRQRAEYNHTGVVVALPDNRSQYRINRSQYRIERTEGRHKGQQWYASADSLRVIEAAS